MEKIITNQVICSSDRNIKENIQDLRFTGKELIDKIKEIGFKSFNFKDDPLKNKVYGVIAQEVQNAGLNELVIEKEDKTLAVDYTSLTILKLFYIETMFKAVLNTNTELKKRIEELEKKLENK